jgi:hypothetical protein
MTGQESGVGSRLRGNDRLQVNIYLHFSSNQVAFMQICFHLLSPSSYLQLVMYSGVIITESYYFTKVFFMDNMQKLNAINKIIRELEDISNSSTSLLKKIAQVEAENINLGNKILEQKIPDIYFKMDPVLSDTNTLLTEFTEFRDDFIIKNRLNEGQAPAA